MTPSSSTINFGKFLASAKPVRFLKRFREIWAPPKSTASLEDYGIPGIKWISLACLLLWFNDEELEPINEYEKTLHDRMKKLRALARREATRAANLRQRQR